MKNIVLSFIPLILKHGVLPTKETMLWGWHPASGLTLILHLELNAPSLQTKKPGLHKSHTRFYSSEDYVTFSFKFPKGNGAQNQLLILS